MLLLCDIGRTPSVRSERSRTSDALTMTILPYFGRYTCGNHLHRMSFIENSPFSLVVAGAEESLRVCPSVNLSGRPAPDPLQHLTVLTHQLRNPSAFSLHFEVAPTSTHSLRTAHRKQSPLMFSISLRLTYAETEPE
jgi:hypothetical protein